MLFIYDVATGQIVSVTGITQYTPYKYTITPAEPLPEGQGWFFINDWEKIQKVWETKTKGGTIELVFDDEGNPVDVQCEAA